VFLHCSSRQSIHILYNGSPLPVKIAPSHTGSGVGTHLTWILATIKAHSRNGILIGSGVVAQLTAEYPYTLRWATYTLPWPPLSPSKLPLGMRGSGPPSNGSLSPPEIDQSLESISQRIEQNVLNLIDLSHGQYKRRNSRMRWDSERRELFLRQRTFNHFTQCAPEATEFAEITQNKGHHTVQGHSRSPILVPIESIYDFLVAINTNLPPILHRFRDIAFDRSKSLYLAIPFFNRV